MKKFTKEEYTNLTNLGVTRFDSGDYSDITEFGKCCSFGKGCSFGDFCSFGKGCYFGEGCSFGEGSPLEGCYFGGGHHIKTEPFNSCTVQELKCA